MRLLWEKRTTELDGTNCGRDSEGKEIASDGGMTKERKGPVIGWSGTEEERVWLTNNATLAWMNGGAGGAGGAAGGCVLRKHADAEPTRAE